MKLTNDAMLNRVLSSKNALLYQIYEKNWRNATGEERLRTQGDLAIKTAAGSKKS